MPKKLALKEEFRFVAAKWNTINGTAKERRYNVVADQ